MISQNDIEEWASKTILLKRDVEEVISKNQNIENRDCKEEKNIQMRGR